MESSKCIGFICCTNQVNPVTKIPGGDCRRKTMSAGGNVSKRIDAQVRITLAKAFSRRCIYVESIT
jgi:hypothetical protein